MKKNFLFLGYLTLAIMLIGAGCVQTSDNKVQSKPAEEQTQNPTRITDAVEQKSGGFTLSVEQPDELGKKKAVYVKFFNVPEDLKKNAEGYRIVMGKNANPTQENATYWYQLGKTHEDKILTGLPSGIRHFRVCVMENNQCVAYTNNTEINLR
ncbi:MAG: hypothetical protein AAB390_02005 [Patescibacteria group bacterium]